LPSSLGQGTPLYTEDFVFAIIFFALGWTAARAGRRHARTPCTTARSRLLQLLLFLQQLLRRRRLFTRLLCCLIEPLHWLRRKRIYNRQNATNRQTDL
jgi:hypothetical protein